LAGNEAMSNVSLSAASAAGYNITYAANTLPTGVSLSGNTIFGTPTVEQTVYTALTATAATTGRSATRYVSWSIALGDVYWKYNTLLIPGASTTFVDDASTNNFAVTIAGDTKPNSFNPYTPGYYSNYFDGSGDYLTVSAGANSFPGDFTFEFWFYPTTDGYSAISGDTNNSYLFQRQSGNISVYMSGTDFPIGTGSAPTNTWTHIAWVRNGTTSTLYINGVNNASRTLSGTLGSASTMYFGARGDLTGYTTGYISNLRIVKGTAVYTTTFTPPTAPLTAIANTVLLTCQSNRFIDLSTNNFTITVAGNTTVNSFDPFMPNSSYSTYGSGYFDGTGDYLSVAYNSAFNVAGGTFTIEAWVNITGTFPANGDGNRLGAIAVFGLATVSQGWEFNIDQTNNILFFSAMGNNSNLVRCSYTFAQNTWYHIAMVRNGSTNYLFVNGISQTLTFNGYTGGSAGSGTLNVAAALKFANYNHYITGYISNFRIVNGTAVYTANFTPSTTPLTAIANTSLLTLQNNQPVNNSTFLDNSTNNFLVTRAGNATQGTFSPYGGNWSNYFDGNGDYLTLNGSPGTTLTGNFTLEAWVYVINFAASRAIICIGDVFGNPGVMFFIDTAGKLGISYANSRPYTGSGSLTANTWNHVAFVRNSGVITGYINGVSQGTLSTANTFSGTTSYIGLERYNGGAGGVIMFGYISNLRIVNSTAVYTGTFTPPTTPLTPITNTGLLTCADNRLIDDSINNFTITKNGDVSVQRFSPFNPSSLTPTSYSGYFGTANGNSLYLSAQSSGTGGVALSGDYTIEMWLYPTGASGSGYSMLVATNTTGGFFQFYYNSSGNIGYYTPAFGQPTTSSAPLTFNTWQHIALVRSSNVVKVYVNGVEKAFSSTITDSSTVYANYIGGLGTVYNTFGYISNLRVNNTAIYTTTFTPPTSPLTAISGTQLLTLQSDTIIDNSTNKYTINVVGSPQPTIQNPFGYTSTTTNGYTPSTIGGSGYFDGSGDYLTGPTSNASLLMGTGDFTIEYWAYKTTSTSVATVVSFGSGGGNLRHFIDNVTPTVWDGASQLGGGNTINLNSWNHIVVQRSGTTLRFYTNGISSATITNSSNFNAGTISIGGGDANAITGYISDLRIVKGRALYTSNFVPPSAPLTAVQNTVLLNNMTSAGIYDAAMMNNLETVGDAKLSTAVSKFGGSSMSFDGSGDYLSANPIGAGDLGTGDFTIEYWMNASAVGSYSGPAGTQEVAGFATAGMWRCLNRFNSSNGIYFAYTTGSTFVDITFTATNYNDGTWHHVAYVKSGTSLKAYVDGTQVGTAATVTQSLTSGKKLTLGYNPQDNAYYTGYVDDLRITKGYARYTSNFTPPTSALQIK